jgi:hypothetical protein
MKKYYPNYKNNKKKSRSIFDEETKQKFFSEEIKQKQDFIDKYTKIPIMNPECRKMKTIAFLIRTVILTVLYLIFWKYGWVKWTLIVFAPLTLINFFNVIFIPLLVTAAIKKAKKRIEDINEIAEHIFFIDE